MKLWWLLARSMVFIWNLGQRFRSLRALKRQILNILSNDIPKFILVTSRADADACAAAAAYLLAHNLTVNDVWFRHVKAGKEYFPHSFERWLKIPIIHFDTGRKFDGEVVNGKVVKPGHFFFDHHHALEAKLPELLEHCATSLVAGSFPTIAKDPIVRFMAEYVRLIDLGRSGEASEFLHRYTRNDYQIIHHCLNLSRFFEVFRTEEVKFMLKPADEAVFVLTKLFTELNKNGQYVPELDGIKLCFNLVRATYKVVRPGETGVDQTAINVIAKNFRPAREFVLKLIEKLRDPDPEMDEDLYFSVYCIEPSNMAILRDISAYISGLQDVVLPDEQICQGVLKFLSFYYIESRRRQLLRELLPGGAFRLVHWKDADDKAVRVLIAKGVPFVGKTVRVNIRQTLHSAVDLIIFSSAHGQIGLILVDEKNRKVINLHDFKEKLVATFPIYKKPSYVHDTGFMMELKTDRAIQGERITLEQVLVLAEKYILGDDEKKIVSLPPVVAQSESISM